MFGKSVKSFKDGMEETEEDVPEGKKAPKVKKAESAAASHEEES